ncbi:MAG: polysaccharide biosynthesis/export family protein [Giesbergeria sp.]
MLQFQSFFRTHRPLLALLTVAGALLAASAGAQQSPSSTTAATPATVVRGLDAPARQLVEVGAVPSTQDSEYKITPSDLLEIEVFGVSELKRTVRVNTNGQIAMPLIGTLTVAGLTPADAEALVALQYKGKNFLQDPQVSIFVKEFTTQRITLDGALMKPGIYPLTGQITLLRALALAGGSGPLADMENVMLFRITPDGQSLVEKFNVDQIRMGEAPDPPLQGDDVVVVNRNSKRAAVRDSLFRDIIDTLNPFAARIP